MNGDHHRPSGESQRTLPEYTRLDPTGPKAFQVNPAGVAVYWADYKRLLDALRPYRDELLKIAADVGEPDDPFAAWEAIQALLDRIEELKAAVAPFAAFADGIDHFSGWSRPGTYAYESSVVGSRNITEDDFRRARKALSGEKP